MTKGKDSAFGDYDGGHGRDYPAVTEFDEVEEAGSPGTGSGSFDEEEVVTRAEFETGSP